MTRVAWAAVAGAFTALPFVIHVAAAAWLAVVVPAVALLPGLLTRGRAFRWSVVALGWLFDRLGRRVMISTTYAVSALLLLGTGVLFAHGDLSAYSQTALWSAIFFVASAAASSAYLTVSEIFPLELRALAIAVFYSVGTAVGGVFAPWLFGELIGSGSRWSVFGGYAVGALLMLVAAVVEAWIGVDAERTSLERVAPPLSVVIP